jgi:hypothetical protein
LVFALISISKLKGFTYKKGKRVDDCGGESGMGASEGRGERRSGQLKNNDINKQVRLLI